MNFPNLPDNLHKALFIIGGLLIAFAYYKYDQNELLIDKEIESINEKANESYFQKLKVNHLITEFRVLCWEESQKLKIKNFMELDRDGDLQFYKIMDGTAEAFRISDSLNIIWQEIENERELIFISEEKYELRLEEGEEKLSIIDERNMVNAALSVLGLLILSAGLIRWEKNQRIQDEIIKSQLPKRDYINHCQSCGRNFSFRVERGTNKDNSESDMFCSDCFIKGKFTSYLDEKSFKETIETELNKLHNKKAQRVLTKRFSDLKRWKLNDYD